MVKPVNERPADEFGNHKLDMDKLDYSDEKTEKALKAQKLAKQLADMYKNTLIVCADADADSDEPLGIGSGLISSLFKAAHNSHEQEVILEGIFTSVVENMIEAGMLGRHNKGDHQHAYELFAKLAGYYAYQFPDNVEDRFGILKQVGMPTIKEDRELMKRKAIRHLKKQGINVDEENLKFIDAKEMNSSQLKDLFTMLGADPEKVLKGMKKEGVVEIGHLNLNKMTKDQKESLTTLLDISLSKLEKKKGKKVTEAEGEKKPTLNFIQISFQPEYRTDGLIANQQGFDDIEAFLDDDENIDNGVFEQMWDDDDCWEEGGRFAGLGLDRSNKNDFKMAKAMWMDGRHYAAGQIDTYADIVKEEMKEKGDKNVK